METILVVDDEEKIRATLRGVLMDEGFAVAEAVDGRHALDLIDQTRPRLAIVDVWMPELDGVELVAAIRERAPDLPVIVISGHGLVETAMRVTELGAAQFLEKPFTLESLLDSVARALGRRRRRVEAAGMWPPPGRVIPSGDRLDGSPRGRSMCKQRTVAQGGPPPRASSH